MTQVVTNPSADREEKIEHAAKILRASKQANAVFMAVYQGNRRCKMIEDMRRDISGFNANTYRAANRLEAENILDKKRLKGKDTYCKISFYTHNRDRILRLSKNSKRLKKYPTKRKILVSHSKSTFTFQTRPKI